MSDIASWRVQYETAGLDVADVDADPFVQWHRWFAEAVDARCVEPNAMVLATCDGAGFPQARYVLAREVDERGFVFHTNYQSDKSRELDLKDKAALLFTWLQVHRQVRIVGTVERLDTAASDAYFAGRPRSSQIGAWASPQSSVLADRDELDERVAQFAATFAEVDEVPRPAFWGGWVVRPLSFEFWQGRADRLHDRLRYTRDGGAWRIERLAP